MVFIYVYFTWLDFVFPFLYALFTVQHWAQNQHQGQNDTDTVVIMIRYLFVSQQF